MLHMLLGVNAYWVLMLIGKQCFVQNESTLSLPSHVTCSSQWPHPWHLGSHNLKVCYRNYNRTFKSTVTPPRWRCRASKVVLFDLQDGTIWSLRWCNLTSKVVQFDLQGGTIWPPSWCNLTSKVVQFDLQGGAIWSPRWCNLISKVVQFNLQGGAI